MVATLTLDTAGRSWSVGCDTLDGMTNEPTPLDELIDQARRTRHERETLEVALELCRRTSRDVALQLLFDHQLPLSKVSLLTGHMRPTLRVWVESETARRTDNGLSSPTIP